MFVVSLVVATSAEGFECVDCDFITSVEVLDFDGNPVFDEYGNQVLEFDSWAPVAVTMYYMIPGNEELAANGFPPLPYKAIATIKGAYGETFVKTRKIRKAGEYSHRARYLVLPYSRSNTETATIKCVLQLKKRHSGSVAREVVDIDIDVGPLDGAE
jgi:hypothetical protein